MATTEHHVVIVGAGAAGHAAVRTLRNEGHLGAITLVHGEKTPPYQRTLVNKAVLPGILAPEQITLSGLGDLGAEIVHGRAHHVERTTPGRVDLVLVDGRRLGADALLAASGSAPNRHVAGDERVLSLHTLQDAAQVRALLGEGLSGARVTILGAGLVGAETASELTKLGATVHLVARPVVPLASVLGHTVASRVVDLHREHVDAHFGRALVTLDCDPGEVRCTLDDGTRLASDVVMVAHGTVPASDWLTGRGGGISVDDRLRATGHVGVYAAGGVAVHRTLDEIAYRVDHWDAAAAQGAHAARVLLHDLAGAPDPGPYVPATGFTSRLHGHSLGGFGVALPGATQVPIAAPATSAVVTGLHAPGTGRLTALVGLDAARELAVLRTHLQRP